METKDKKKSIPVRHGVPSSPKELKASEKCWKDMEDCFAGLKKKK